MKTLLLAAALAATLTAPAAAAAAQVDAKSYSDRVVGLSEIQRLAVMRRAILDAGEQCQRPVAAQIQGPWKNMIMWTARCVPGGDYGVFIGPNALVQVRQCKQTAQLKLPTCADPTRKPAAPAPR